MSRHRHERNSWLIAGGWIEWCYQCGAWRQMQRMAPNGVSPAGKWQKPTGIDGPNPALKDET